MYAVKIQKQAAKKLESLSARDKLRITNKIMELSWDPDSTQLDTKKLSGRSILRLRVGSWRIIYEKDDSLKILYIEKIKSRGDVYK